MNCYSCGKPLNQAQFHNQLKSCPRCSVKNTNEHIFYSYPQAFGNTPRRASSNHPDGPQSHCYACRGGQEQESFTPVKCSEKQ